MASLVSQVETLSELGAAGAVDCANILDDAVDAGSELGAARKRRNANRRLVAKVAHYVNDNHLRAKSESHARNGHGKESDWRLLRNGAA